MSTEANKFLIYTTNLFIAAGGTFSKRLVWQVNGLPVDLTGHTAIAWVADQDTGEMLVEMTTENGGVELGADGGIDLLIEDEETRTLGEGPYQWGIKVVTPTGATRRLLKGLVFVDPEVVRVAT